MDGGKHMKPKHKQCRVTTSWDDGHQDDLRLTRMLKKYDLPATLYVCPFNREFSKRELLSKRQIRTLSTDFEIGAHTLTHPHLTKIPLEEAKKEIAGSKQHLEDMLGIPIASFCYPAGYYNEQIISIVRNAGFRIARTTRRYATPVRDMPYTTPTTVHAYNHFSDIHHLIALSRGNIGALYRYRSWEYVAMDLFDLAVQNGSVFHLWGHSWEIETHNAWEKLERVFQHIARHPRASYVTNGELFS